MKLSKNMFSERERGLENEFFYRADQQLLQRLKEKAETEKGRATLADVTGFSDPALLDELLNAGIRAECVVALTLVPLVQIAWADPIMDAREREAVLQAAHDAGVEESSASYDLLTQWLQHKPDPSLFETWKHYAAAIAERLGPEQAARLQQDVLKRTLTVAESAGGILGIGAVSAAEEAVLKEIEQAFQH